ncbi:tryptophan--tRNA ligase [Paenibacillus herberti]|uniref:Tryptophan--tRNA ligase n=1 Tax=Paenibacillus herberti TaxID=1619309 RepID=A0A229NTY1_9BACL|nr:tryptophan--tRNA ligase [Paenibacillus herberti]OXM13357.1 tryptophan--tRNA ligase [Paenibacillus herberti]
MANRIVSGIKPSGDLNIGGYGGALSQFIQLQQDYDCFFFIPDLHAITVPQPPDVLQRRTRDIAALYLAAGIDPGKSVLFLQSQVPAHAELGYLLQTLAVMGELGRMTQYKDKSDGKSSVSSALFTYPVLMAADVLLYRTTHVPVGDDQLQHLELARDLARRFNQRFGVELFLAPEPIIGMIGSRIMGLDDPSAKMSKSNPNTNSCVMLMDSPELIRRKFAKAVTDSEGIVRYDWESKPAVSNLVEIYAVFSGLSVEEIERRYDGKGYSSFKSELVDVVIEKLVPLQARYHEWIGSPELDRILKEGAQRAAAEAAPVLAEAKRAMGFASF